MGCTRGAVVAVAAGGVNPSATTLFLSLVLSFSKKPDAGDAAVAAAPEGGGGGFDDVEISSMPLCRGRLGCGGGCEVPFFAEEPEPPSEDPSGYSGFLLSPKKPFLIPDDV